VPACLSGEDEIWVEADPDRLTMIVEHVIRNAQDATDDDGKVTVTVGFGGEPSAADAADTSRLPVPSAVLTVTDTGAGMSRQFIQERLFKPFDTSKGSKGMGIGAYQVREYVQSLGGRVHVASELGSGTRFTLRIPLAIPPDSDTSPTSPALAGEVGRRPGEGSSTSPALAGDVARSAGESSSTSPALAGEVGRRPGEGRATEAGEGASRPSPQSSTASAGEGA
jgi:hypothetical protein